MGNIKEKFLLMFNFSQKEIKGVFVLIIILVFVLLIPVIRAQFISQESLPNKTEQAYLDSLAKVLVKQSFSDSTNKIDPNKLSYYQWMGLGISSDLANDILRKKRKQKQFNCIDEIKEISGVNSSELVNYFEVFALPVECPKIVKKLSVYRVNSVTKKELSEMSGISYKIARRIVAYRNKLGGFNSLRQLKEVQNLPDKEYSILKSRLIINRSKIVKVKINTISRFELKKHPYLTAKQASTIVNYRKKIGSYDNVDSFRKVYGLTEKDITKLSPYLSFE
jgi:competence protein ComEA